MRVLVQALVDDELGFAGRRRPNCALARQRGQVEAAGNTDAGVVALEDRENRLDGVPDAVVVRDQFFTGCPGSIRASPARDRPRSRSR